MDKSKTILSRNISEVIIRDHLERDLTSGIKLRIKLGADPTAPDLHLGHSVVLRKLREFQDLGHTVVFIIGDFTALIGDPTGKNKTRPALSPETIAKNAKTYLEQVGNILNVKKCEIHFNSEWFSKWDAQEMIKLRAQFSLKRILERDDFAARMKNPKAELAAHETDYPMLQAYDSVAIKADVEIGGTDQKFNMLAGRDLQRKMGFPEQDIITCPLLVGLDGHDKMSKSLGNYVGLTDAPEDMYGKIMSIPDNVILQYFELVTDLSLEELAKIKKDLTHGKNPRDVKMQLAREIVKMYHGTSAALKAEKNFVQVFQKHQTPDKATSYKLPASSKLQRGEQAASSSLAEILIKIKLVASKSEARRVIEQGGVKVDGKVMTDPNKIIKISKDGVLIQKGKRYFVRISN